MAARASCAPKFFYDRLGSHLFEAITELDEYYPTRTEAAIFAAHGAAMAAAAGTATTLIDLGAGNCAKAARLFPLLEPRRYVAVDISVDFLRDALRQVQRDHPQLEIVGLGQDFSVALDVPAELVADAGRCSSIRARASATSAPTKRSPSCAACANMPRGGGLLIGVDLVKPRAVLEAAYDDALGVTAAFNLQPPAPPEPADRQRFRSAALAPRRLSSTKAAARIEMHLEATREPSRVVAGRDRGALPPASASTPRTRASTPSRASPPCSTTPASRTSGTGATPRGWFAVFWAGA